METQNETPKTQEEITQTEVSIDPKMQPSAIDPKMNDLQMINVKDYVHVDPDMIPFNDLQMTPKKYLAVKLMLKSNAYTASEIFNFARS